MRRGGFGGHGWGHEAWGHRGWGGPPVEVIPDPLALMAPPMDDASTGYEEIVGYIAPPAPPGYPAPPAPPGFHPGYHHDFHGHFHHGYGAGFMPDYEVGADGALHLNDRRGLPLQGGYELGYWPPAPPPPRPQPPFERRGWQQYAQHRGWDRGHQGWQHPAPPGGYRPAPPQGGYGAPPPPPPAYGYAPPPPRPPPPSPFR